MNNVIIQGMSAAARAARQIKYKQAAEELIANFSTKPTCKIPDSVKKIQELSGRFSSEIKTLKMNGKDVDFVTYAGSQQGSNPGRWAKIKGTDELYYIKFPKAGEQNARSEQLASELYKLAGIDSGELSLVITPKGNIGIASKYMPFDTLPTGADAPLLREGFAADCWLANWDALKHGNTVMAGGRPIRLDVGGSLCYRAQGGRKGAAFGEDVHELTSFFESFSQSRRYLQDMTREELLKSLSRVTNISDKHVDNLINNASYSLGNGLELKRLKDGTYVSTLNMKETLKRTGIENPEFLKETLKARKTYLRYFELLCERTPQKSGESIAEYIKRVESMMPKTEYSIPFDKVTMSSRVKKGGLTLAETLTPSQKKLYEASAKAYKESRKLEIKHPETSDILTTDSMLHSTDIESFNQIIKRGIISGDCRPLSQKGSGTGWETLTPLCADFWDVRETMKIKDYFSRKIYNTGEKNFLPQLPNHSGNQLVFVVNKKSVNKTLLENSFRVNRDTRIGLEDTLLDLDGNMGGYFEYITHRAVPFGVPANSIDRVLLDPKYHLPVNIQTMKNNIAHYNLDIKLYDFEGNLL